MKCAILTRPGELDIIERDSPACGEYDVIVKVEICGVCRTDRKCFNMGQRDLVTPRVLGHEIAGRVYSVGPGVTGWLEGDRVQVSPGVFCGECDYCRGGIDNLCDHMRIIGFHLDGGFSDLLLVPGAGREPGILNRIPESLDFAAASLAEPLACAVNLQKRLHIEGTVVIFGAGPLGILSAQLARNLGAGKIIIVEPMESRRRVAALYSDIQIDVKDREYIMELTEGSGADVVIPCCPGNEPFLLALEVAAKRGRVGFFSGLTDRSDLTNKELNTIHYKELSVVGAYGCSLNDNREALDLLAAGAVNVRDVPSLTVSWEGLPRIVSQLQPFEHVFTYFTPYYSGA